MDQEGDQACTVRVYLLIVNASACCFLSPLPTSPGGHVCFWSEARSLPQVPHGWVRLKQRGRGGLSQRRQWG